jgi:hypothetical protein
MKPSASVPILPLLGEEVGDRDQQVVFKAEQIGEISKGSEEVLDLKEATADGAKKSVSVTKHKKTHIKILGKQTPQVEEVSGFKKLFYIKFLFFYRNYYIKQIFISFVYFINIFYI